MKARHGTVGAIRLVRRERLQRVRVVHELQERIMQVDRPPAAAALSFPPAAVAASAAAAGQAGAASARHRVLAPRAYTAPARLAASRACCRRQQTLRRRPAVAPRRRQGSCTGACGRRGRQSGWSGR
eukprot:357713-Chlamydomonas_euryale.AAC.11